jgi:acetyl esterase/lipase
MPAGTGHFEFAAKTMRQAEEGGKSLCFAFIQHGLAPANQYPSQLSQCVEVLQYTLQTLGKDPSKVILVGDSAGGTLVMSMISHLLHPHPGVSPVKLATPLRAAALFSPWINLEMTGSAVLQNQIQDPVSPEVMRS